MGLPDFVGASLNGPIAIIRRYIISLAVAIAAAIAAVFYAASAAMLALETALGPIVARVGVAVLLIAIAVAGYFAPRLFSRKTPLEEAHEETAGMTRDQRIAMVFEALLLGFSMGSRKPAESSDSRK